MSAGRQGHIHARRKKSNKKDGLSENIACDRFDR